MFTQMTFKALEHRGWSERARIYDHYSGRFCRFGIAALIDAARISRGQSTLDVCCGTGEASLAAAARGAIVTGIDFCEEMIAEAKAKGSNVNFQVGDAEALIFEDAAFHRVINNFGTLHLADPDKAIAEAARVLRPGGRYAYTVWRGPDVSPLFRILPEVVSAHGTLDVDLPPAPPLFRFAEREEAMRVLSAAGFTDITFAGIPATLDFPLAELSDFFHHAFVRSTMVLERQEPAARARIEQALGESFQPFTENGVVHLPLPALVVSATRA
ncbi:MULTISPECIES: methyltransferase domain-containing protein [unclassified Sinorhizobium]|uniref:class I SAM-dependent methyltransferase n=1 Tax=unclassified Sinorhizobium TaxID=2613772 RepID=UPI0024C2F8B2|nr:MULTISPECIES: methyltransferase domain-containing protein [unclassified Sinorhizobium]MDK1373523.1 methyltransferase domain-containing protein [Sinorhizobium sp. 6-70]MDK1482959.1 methyltransferase domain-containing protein [Sinorhizobium sp. 6-117]